MSYYGYALSEKTPCNDSTAVALETSQVVSSKHATAVLQPLVFTVCIPQKHHLALDDLQNRSRRVVSKMLLNREMTSTKFYKEVPSVVAKSLSKKYQRNPKCKRVKRLVIPICGEKGRVIKLVPGGIRVPSLFKAESLPVQWPRPVFGFIRNVELYRRGSQWHAKFCVNVAPEAPINVSGVIGVDRNSSGNIAVMADVVTGHVRHLGFNPAPTKRCWRNRKKNLQRQGKRRLLSKLRKNHGRRSTHQNHIVSKTVVDYAKKHSRAIVIERLRGVNAKGSKIRRRSERSQWSFSELSKFIQYKSRLAGVPVIEVNPAFTSQTCSRCGNIHKPDGKLFRCLTCGHQDHRDANASFVIAQRGLESIGGLAMDSVSHRSGLPDCPGSGTLTELNQNEVNQTESSYLRLENQIPV